MDAKYRKKPVVISAVKTRAAIAAARSDWDALPDWLKKSYEEGYILFRPDGVDIKTLEGVMTAGLDDMIILGVKGEIYPCKPDIFAATYEAVDGSPLS